MIPATPPAGVAVKSAQPITTFSADRTSQPSAPETARSSSGETAAANIRVETADAVTPPEQSAVVPRLRDEENWDQTERDLPNKDDPTGPPPAFEESPLQRQARVSLDPTEASTPPELTTEPVGESVKPETKDRMPAQILAAATDPVETPPTPSERAEISFAETRDLAEPTEPPNVDLAG